MIPAVTYITGGVPQISDKRGYPLLHLISSWLQSTSASVLEESVDHTKVVKLCCSEILS